MHLFRMLIAPFALISALPSTSSSTPAAPSPQRIVTLGAAVTETVFALGAGDQVVARDTSSTYPAAARALPDVGYFRTIGAEGVLSQRPTLILAAQGSGPAEQLELLRSSSIPLVHFSAPPSAESTFALLEGVGAALRRDTEAAALAAAIRTELAAASDLRADRPSVRAVFLLGAAGGSTAQAAGDRTAADTFLKLCGAINAAAGQPGYRTLSAEGVLGLAPDVIFVGIDADAPAHTRPEWLDNTPAGQAGRVHELPLSRLAFGPRLGSAVHETTRLLYPVAPPLTASAP